MRLLRVLCPQRAVDRGCRTALLLARPRTATPCANRSKDEWRAIVAFAECFIIRANAHGTRKLPWHYLKLLSKHASEHECHGRRHVHSGPVAVHLIANASQVGVGVEEDES